MSTGTELPNSPARTELGSLRVIPPEIRHLVYQYVFTDERCYSASTSPSLGLLGASKALRREAIYIFYSQTKFHFRFGFKDTSRMRGITQGLSQEVANCLQYIEVSMDMIDYASERPWTFKPDVDHYYKDLFSKLASTHRARKTCRIILLNCTFLRHPWHKLPFTQGLGSMSMFQNVALELECDPMWFEDAGRVDRGDVWSVPGDYFGSAHHMRFVSALEKQREELGRYLEGTLGECHSYERKNIRYLEFRPRSRPGSDNSQVSRI